jgi:hypothetical protein
MRAYLVDLRAFFDQALRTKRHAEKTAFAFFLL